MRKTWLQNIVYTEKSESNYNMYYFTLTYEDIRVQLSLLLLKISPLIGGEKRPDKQLCCDWSWLLYV